MAELDSDNIIEQLAQIDSTLSGTSTIEGELENISQVDSAIGNIVPVDFSGFYEGSISSEDWLLQGGYYYYTVSHNTHRLANPFLDNVLVETNDGYDNAYYSYTRLPNGDIRFRSSMAISCVYRIAGER